VSGSLTLAPDNAPAGIGPGSLWANVETIEEAQRRSTLPQFDICPAPRTDPPAVCTLAVRSSKKFVDRGMCATIAFHHIGGDNPHFHLMTDARHCDDQDGFKNKNRDWNDKQYLDHWRSRMGTLCQPCVDLGQLTSALTTAR
jgi:hypothetical protein